MGEWLVLRNQSRRRLGLSIGRFRCKAGIRAGNLLASLIRRDGLRTNGDGSGHELVDQLMQADLSAQVLGPWPQAVARGPSGDAQLAILFMCYKPVVGLLLFAGAYVARNCLPDHRIPLFRTTVPTP